jgi:predicted nucleotidyltransferase
MREPEGRVTGDPVLERIRRTIVEHLRPRRVVLFGSRARGSAAPDSDYDIMVEMETDLPDAVPVIASELLALKAHLGTAIEAILSGATSENSR